VTTSISPSATSFEVAIMPGPSVAREGGVYRTLTLAQRFARHVSPLTTVVYTHPSDEEMACSIRTLAC
jgi:hypothetical protein